MLGKRHQEQQVALGLANNGGVMELFRTADGSTWTLVLTMPNGVSCLFATGEDWQDVKPLMGQVM